MSLRLIDEINVQYEKHIRREVDEYDKKQEILNMKLSHNNQFLAVMIGHHLVQDESEKWYNNGIIQTAFSILVYCHVFDE